MDGRQVVTGDYQRRCDFGSDRNDFHDARGLSAHSLDLGNHFIQQGGADV